MLSLTQIFDTLIDKVNSSFLIEIKVHDQLTTYGSNGRHNTPKGHLTKQQEKKKKKGPCVAKPYYLCL